MVNLIPSIRDSRTTLHFVVSTRGAGACNRTFGEVVSLRRGRGRLATYEANARKC